MTRIFSRLLAALSFVLLAAAPALAQNYNIPAHAIAIGRGTNVSAFTSVAPAANTKFLVGGGTSADPVMQTMSGDCTLSAGAVTCTKTSGVAFAASATTDTTNANNVGSGTLPNARLDPEVQCLAGLTSAADKIAYYTGSGTCALADFSSAERTYLTTSSSANLRGVLTDEVGTGAAYFVGGALGTPASVTLTNGTGLPISGISGLGTGVGTALAVNTGSAGAPVLFNGAGGTPSALTLTNATGLPLSGITGSTSTALGVGSLELGAASDTTLARGSAGVLTVEGVTVPTISSTSTLTNKSLTAPVLTGTADVQQALLLSGDISPTQIVANTNDYAPTGFSTATTLRLNTDASRNITGLAGGAAGRLIVIHNVGSFNIVLTNQDTLSTAGNRFLFGGDLTLVPDSSVSIKYDATSSRWRTTTSAGSGGGGGGSGTVTSAAIAAGVGIATSGTCTITTSGTCTVSMADQYRQNDLMMCANQAKSQAAYIRLIETFCDGYKASDGVNAGSSSNYAVNTSSGYVGPSPVPATLSYRTTVTSTVDQSTYTFTSADIGTAVSNRIVILGITNATGSTGSITSVTVGGNAATAIVTAGSGQYASLYAIAVPTGTTATIVVTYSAGMVRATVSVWAAYGISITPYATATAAADPYSTTINVSAGGLLFGVMRDASNSTVTWTGLTEDYDAPTETQVVSAASLAVTATETGRSVQADVAAASAGAAVYASFQLASIVSNNMTLVTTSQTADASVSNGRVLMEIDPIDSITLNTDLTAEVTCDGGTNWAAATLSSIGKGQSGRTVVETADTAATAGTSFAARIKTLNNKSVNVYKTTLVVH